MNDHLCMPCAAGEHASCAAEMLVRQVERGNADPVVLVLLGSGGGPCRCDCECDVLSRALQRQRPPVHARGGP